MCHRSGMRVTGVDAARRGWVAVSLERGSMGPPSRSGRDRPWRRCSRSAQDPAGTTTIGIDMPLGLLETGWREADRAARSLLGPRRSSVFAIPPRAVWAEASYPAEPALP